MSEYEEYGNYQLTACDQLDFIQHTTDLYTANNIGHNQISDFQDDV